MPGNGELKGGRVRAQTILVIEDHADTLMATSRFLANKGYHVLTATSCAHARKVVDSFSGCVDVVLGDIGLPDGDGAKLMAEIKALHGCRAVAVTGFGQASDLARYRLMNVDECLVKPLNLDALIKALTPDGLNS